MSGVSGPNFNKDHILFSRPCEMRFTLLKPQRFLRITEVITSSVSIPSYCFYRLSHTFVLFPPTANEAGETPLDIARRLKHLQCEELVSLHLHGNESPLCLGFCFWFFLVFFLIICLRAAEPSAGGEVQRPCPRGVRVVPAARRPGRERRRPG